MENKQGYMSGRLYYSSTLPQGSKEAKNTKWSMDDSKLFEIAQSDTANTEHAFMAGKRLAELGYLEPHLVTGRRDNIIDGAILRWRINTSDDVERMWFDMESNEDLMSKGLVGIRKWWHGN